MTTLTVFCGLPGSGKTYAATRLEAETGALRISRDELRARLFDTPAYTDAEKRAVFRVMLVLAEYHLGTGRDVILDGMPFSRRSERDAARQVAESAGASFDLCQCVCPDEVALERIAGQQHLAPDRNAALYFAVKERFEPIGEDERPRVLRT